MKIFLNILSVLFIILSICMWILVNVSYFRNNIDMVFGIHGTYFIIFLGFIFVVLGLFLFEHLYGYFERKKIVLVTCLILIFGCLFYVYKLKEFSVSIPINTKECTGNSYSYEEGCVVKNLLLDRYQDGLLVSNIHKCVSKTGKSVTLVNYGGVEIADVSDRYFGKGNVFIATCGGPYLGEAPKLCQEIYEEFPDCGY